jgi:hypothetical protein
MDAAEAEIAASDPFVSLYHYIYAARYNIALRRRMRMPFRAHVLF